MLIRFRLLAAVAAALVASTVAARDVINLTGAEARAALAQYRSELTHNPQDFDALKSAGVLLHQMSRSSPTKDQVEEGERYLKQAAQVNPKDPETAAWLGSLTTMKALFESDPGKQTFWVKFGSRLMDSAVQQDPETE
jgi:hypothetical protein